MNLELLERPPIFLIALIIVAGSPPAHGGASVSHLAPSLD
jgi:hypothetical protein